MPGYKWVCFLSGLINCPGRSIVRVPKKWAKQLLKGGGIIKTYHIVSHVECMKFCKVSDWF